MIARTTYPRRREPIRLIKPARRHPRPSIASSIIPSKDTQIKG